MPEKLVDLPESSRTDVLEGLCTRITELYPQLHGIQYKNHTSGHTSFTVIPKESLQPQCLEDIQQEILLRVSQLGGVSCSEDVIRVAVPEEALCFFLNKKYQKHGVVIQFSQKPERNITISGVFEPSIKSAITGDILAGLPRGHAGVQIDFSSHVDDPCETEPLIVRIQRILVPLLKETIQI